MKTTAAQRFSETAAGYAATMAPSLRPVAAEVVGVDAAPGMLEIARAEVADVDFAEMDFGALAFDDASFDVVIAVHALLFASDRTAVLHEWLRVTRPGGRLSLSVPGPDAVTPSAIYGAVYERYGINTKGDYPTPESLVELASAAGWDEVSADSDASTAIVLADEAAFRTWREIGSRGAATADFTPEQHLALTEEMLAVTPRDDDGRFRIPFGAIYLTARSAK